MRFDLFFLIILEIDVALVVSLFLFSKLFLIDAGVIPWDYILIGFGCSFHSSHAAVFVQNIVLTSLIAEERSH